MSTRHPLLPLLLTAGCLSCGQDGPTPLENRAPLFSAVHPSGAPLIVDDDGAQCSDAQFTSIQAAVDAAAPGDRILVCTGTYLEQVTVSTNDVRIHAQNKAGPYGRGRRASVVVDAHGHDFGFRVLNASGVMIEGFDVEHAHEADIFLSGASATTIRSNVTTGAGHDGIELVGSHDNVIEHNVSIDNPAVNACGINVAGGSLRNVVRHNRLVNNEWGIQISGGTTADNVIAHNVSLGNRGNGIRNVGGASGTRIEQNRASSNGSTPSASTTGTTNAGIHVASGTNIVVRDNQALDNLAVDLRSEAGSGATFAGNHCRTSSPSGLCERSRPSTSP